MHWNILTNGSAITSREAEGFYLFSVLVCKHYCQVSSRHPEEGSRKPLVQSTLCCFFHYTKTKIKKKVFFWVSALSAEVTYGNKEDMFPRHLSIFRMLPSKSAATVGQGLRNDQADGKSTEKRGQLPSFIRLHWILQEWGDWKRQKCKTRYFILTCIYSSSAPRQQPTESLLRQA